MIKQGFSLPIAIVAKMRQIRESGDKISKVANLNGDNLFQMPGVRSAGKSLVSYVLYSVVFWSFVLWCKDTVETPEADTTELSFSPIGDFTTWNSHLGANIPLCPPINALLIARFKEFGFV